LTAHLEKAGILEWGSVKIRSSGYGRVKKRKKINGKGKRGGKDYLGMEQPEEGRIT